jgi:hypothetical protein
MPKLSLRALFAVVTIVALALGWWMDRWRLAAERTSLATENEFLLKQKLASDAALTSAYARSLEREAENADLKSQRGP